MPVGLYPFSTEHFDVIKLSKYVLFNMHSRNFQSSTLNKNRLVYRTDDIIERLLNNTTVLYKNVF